MAVEDSRLTPLQREILDGFFARTSEFWLTGGAALVGLHLGHRTTHDLDLFTRGDALDEGTLALEETVRALGASVERLRTSPPRRFLVRRGDEGIAVDLVRDTTLQGPRAKPLVGRVRLDPPEEILANKLCTLLSRAEIRDLVDVLELEKAGFSVDEALPLAMAKDGGLTPAQLAWILSELTIADAAGLPGQRSAEELRQFVTELVERLTRLARPG